MDVTIENLEELSAPYLIFCQTEGAAMPSLCLMTQSLESLSRTWLSLEVSQDYSGIGDCVEDSNKTNAATSQIPKNIQIPKIYKFDKFYKFDKCDNSDQLDKFDASLNWPPQLAWRPCWLNSD